MKKIVSLALAGLLAVALTACGGGNAPSTPQSTPGSVSTPASTPESTPASTPSGMPDSGGVNLTADRAGNPITAPETVTRIVSMSAANTRILYDLGLADKLVAIDSYSAPNLPADMAAELPQLDMTAPDLELLAALAPDILFVSSLSSGGGDDVYAPLREAGTCVAEIPTPDTIAGIFEDVRFIAALSGQADAGEALVADAQAQLDEIAVLVADAQAQLDEIATQVDATSERPGVYFEVSPAPNCYSTGAGTYLDEMITLAGGRNVFGNQQSWISITEEAIVEAAPDVIFTVADYLPDAVEEILARPGWENMPAIQNAAVALISATDSQQPTTHVVDALWAMLEVIHPGLATRQAA